MGRSLKIRKTNPDVLGTDDFVDSGFNNPFNNSYGIVGGIVTQSSTQIDVRVKILNPAGGSYAEADGSIIRQKGTRKFLVTDGTHVGVCMLVDKADGSLATGTNGMGEMTITATRHASVGGGIVRLNALRNKFGYDFDDPPVGYILSFGAPEAAQPGMPYSIAQVSSDVTPSATAVPVITTASPLPGGTATVAYTVLLAASGGGSQTWVRTLGTLPAGLTLAANGTLSGTPTAAGTSNFTVQVTNGAGSATKAFALTIA
jgi:hypothetical protein